MLGASAVERLSAPAAAIGAEDRHTLAEAHAALLCEHVAKREDEPLLVIDDVDQLGDRDTAVTLLRALCLQAPPQLHIGLSGKRVPALGLVSNERMAVTLHQLAARLRGTAAPALQSIFDPASGFEPGVRRACS